MRYSFIELLKQTYRVTELDHAFRINGVVDYYKDRNTVYEIPANFYHKLALDAEAEAAVNAILLKYPERPDFKRRKNGISMQELRNTLKQQRHDPAAINAEDYHWKDKATETSQDHLYFAVVEDKVKIGRSKDPQQRMKELQTGLFKKPKVYVFNNKGCLESLLHRLFSDFRLNGEWFKFDIRIQNFITKYHTPETGYLLNLLNIKKYGKRNKPTARNDKPIFGGFR